MYITSEYDFSTYTPYYVVGGEKFVSLEAAALSILPDMEIEEICAVTNYNEKLNSASFHFADDTCKEWGIGYGQQADAREIRKSFPRLNQIFDSINSWNLAKG